MQFRYARHTNDLAPLIKFYTEVIGLEQLGTFENHAAYNGVFLGRKNAKWHLEFTSSNDFAAHMADEDDLLVFYLNTEVEIQNILSLAARNNTALITPKNPYWENNGYTLVDPDGYRVVISLRSPLLNAPGELSNMVRRKGIEDWNSLVNFVRELPYGRNASREDFSLVIKEGKGTCSSKHAFLKKVADENNIEDVSLVLGIYNMNRSNTPGIGDELEIRHIEYIPEAHCYLMLNGQRVDLTSPKSNIDSITRDLLLETLIEAEQVTAYKVAFHRDFLRKWLYDSGLDISFDELWAVRERCIARLSG